MNASKQTLIAVETVAATSPDAGLQPRCAVLRRGAVVCTLACCALIASAMGGCLAVAAGAGAGYIAGSAADDDND